MDTEEHGTFVHQDQRVSVVPASSQQRGLHCSQCSIHSLRNVTVGSYYIGGVCECVTTDVSLRLNNGESTPCERRTDIAKRFNRQYITSEAEKATTTTTAPRSVTLQLFIMLTASRNDRFVIPDSAAARCAAPSHLLSV